MDQLTVFTENKVGSLSHLLSIISDLDINVRTVSTERANMSEVRLMVDNAASAQEALETHEIKSHIVDVVVVELSDKPGELANITKTLDKAGVNIDYMYGVDNGTDGKGLFAIKTELEASELRKLLKEFSTY